MRWVLRRARVIRGKVAVLCLLAALLAMSLAMPAFGGPQAFSAASAIKVAKNALRKATQADKRSKRALAEAQKVGAKSAPQGPPGAAGAQGPPGAPGAPGLNAFGSLTYVVGQGATISTVDYVADGAPCPSGQAPTGGSAAVSGAELGGTNPNLGDAGDHAIDTNSDGYYDSWLAYAYNATGSAKIVAAAVCAPAARAARAASLPASSARRMEAARALLEDR